jgi:hypothetical protein
MSDDNIITYLVAIDGAWIANRVYWTIAIRNIK